MKKWLWTPVVGALFLGLAASVALAGSNPEASIGLHIQDQISNPNTCDAVLPQSCFGFNTSATDPGDYHIYVMIANFDTVGIAGAQFGISYDEVNGSGFDVTGWVSCGDLQFPMVGWPNSDTGTLMTWEPTQNCQGEDFYTRPVPVTAGVFQVYANGPDSFQITPRQVDGKAKVADCLSAEDDITSGSPSRLGMVTVGGGFGYNPCSPLVSVEPTTWGSIKTLYEQ